MAPWNPLDFDKNFYKLQQGKTEKVMLCVTQFGGGTKCSAAGISIDVECEQG